MSGSGDGGGNGGDILSAGKGAAGGSGGSGNSDGSGNDEKLAQFVAVTGVSEDVANHWLEVSPIRARRFFCCSRGTY